MTVFISLALIWFAGDAATAFYFLVSGKPYKVGKASLLLAFLVRSAFAGWAAFLLYK